MKHPSKQCYFTRIADVWDKCPLPECHETFETVSQVIKHLTDVHGI